MWWNWGSETKLDKVLHNASHSPVAANCHAKNCLFPLTFSILPKDTKTCGEELGIKPSTLLLMDNPLHLLNYRCPSVLIFDRSVTFSACAVQ